MNIYDKYGKCCWTCGNTNCCLSQINGQPPHESSEGRTCSYWISSIKDRKPLVGPHREEALKNVSFSVPDRFPQFIYRVRERLEKGKQRYGDKSFSRPAAELLGELEQEALDLAGWGYVLWCRIRKAQEAIEESGRMAVSESCGCDVDCDWKRQRMEDE